MNEPYLKMEGRLDRSDTGRLFKNVKTINDLPVVIDTMEFPKESLLFMGFTGDYSLWQKFKIWLKPIFPSIKIGPFHATYKFSIRYDGWNDSGLKRYETSSFPDLPGIGGAFKYE